LARGRQTCSPCTLALTWGGGPGRVRQVRGYTGNNYTTITKARGIRYGFQGNTEQAKQSTGACVPFTTHREREREKRTPCNKHREAPA
jgi:hypothetical protein